MLTSLFSLLFLSIFPFCGRGLLFLPLPVQVQTTIFSLSVIRFPIFFLDYRRLLLVGLKQGFHAIMF